MEKDRNGTRESIGSSSWYGTKLSRVPLPADLEHCIFPFQISIEQN